MLSDDDGVSVGAGWVGIGVGGEGIAVGKGVGIAVTVAVVMVVGKMMEASTLCDWAGMGDAAGLAPHPNQSGVSAIIMRAPASLSCIVVPLCKLHQSRAVAAALAGFGLE